MPNIIGKLFKISPKISQNLPHKMLLPILAPKGGI